MRCGTTKCKETVDGKGQFMPILFLRFALSNIQTAKILV
jgi:hypothetical protein